ncbi:hypothetical protein DDZ15_16175 [Rhodohalobacter mucosus]|uniref:Uncharacterized protein n=1 Tax=Rhodohalobacter mucosus TaxID=2079485 RepID=A0A316TS92_9BACT|nr:hypothetical protein DDZ15_16175 [Rhodohalobacter mucosus]
MCTGISVRCPVAGLQLFPDAHPQIIWVWFGSAEYAKGILAGLKKFPPFQSALGTIHFRFHLIQPISLSGWGPSHMKM